MKNLIFHTSLVLFFICVCCFSTYSQKVGEKAPEIKIGQWLNPKQAQNLEGKLIVLDFWATWCGPCIAGLIKSSEWAKKYKDQIVFLAISEEDITKIRTFTQKRPMHHTYIQDAGEVNKGITHSKFHITGIPHIFLIDGSGIIQWEGYKLTEELVKDFITTGKVTLPTHSYVAPNKVSAVPHNYEGNFELIIAKPNSHKTPMSEKGYNRINTDSTIVDIANITLKDLLHHLTKSSSFAPKRLEVADDISEILNQNLQVYMNSKVHTWDEGKKILLQRIEDQFHIMVQPIEIEKEVWVVRLDNKAKLQNHTTLGIPKEVGWEAPSYFDNNKGNLTVLGGKIQTLAEQLETALKIPAFSDTDISGQYDFENLPLDSIPALQERLKKEYGLLLVKEKRKVPYVKVEKQQQTR